MARISASHSSSYLSDIGRLGQTRLYFGSESGFQIDAGLLGEDVAYLAGEGEVNGGAAGQSSNLCAGHVHGGNNQNHVTTHGGDVQVDGGAHHFGHVNLALDAAGGQLNVLGTDA